MISERILRPEDVVVGADQADNGGEAHKRLAPPVHGDVGEEPTLDFVPFARARREVTDSDRVACPVGELLESHFQRRTRRPLLPTRPQDTNQSGIMAHALEVPASGFAGRHEDAE